MQRFQRAVSLTLLILAALMPGTEIFRTPVAYDRGLLSVACAIFCGTAWRASLSLRGGGEGRQGEASQIK